MMPLCGSCAADPVRALSRRGAPAGSFRNHKQWLDSEDHRSAQICTLRPGTCLHMPGTTCPHMFLHTHAHTHARNTEGRLKGPTRDPLLSLAGPLLRHRGAGRSGFLSSHITGEPGPLVRFLPVGPRGHWAGAAGAWELPGLGRSRMDPRPAGGSSSSTRPRVGFLCLFVCTIVGQMTQK